MNTPETKECIGNVDPVKLLLGDIHFAMRKREMAIEDFRKARSVGDEYLMVKAKLDELRWVTTIAQAKKALKYILMERDEREGRSLFRASEMYDRKVDGMIDDILEV